MSGVGNLCASNYVFIDMSLSYRHAVTLNLRQWHKVKTQNVRRVSCLLVPMTCTEACNYVPRRREHSFIAHPLHELPSIPGLSLPGENRLQIHCSHRSLIHLVPSPP